LLGQSIAKRRTNHCERPKRGSDALTYRPKAFSKDEARRIAADVVKFPECADFPHLRTTLKLSDLADAA
jgi:hypothetical protein